VAYNFIYCSCKKLCFHNFGQIISLLKISLKNFRCKEVYDSMMYKSKNVLERGGKYDICYFHTAFDMYVGIMIYSKKN